LEIRKTTKAKVKARVEEPLELVQLEWTGGRHHPNSLEVKGSGSRWALHQPQVLLLMNPLRWMPKCRIYEPGYVAHESSCHHSVCHHHDQEEAMEVADEIVVMNLPSGTGRNASRDYDHPATAFVMSFIGPVNVLPSNSRIFQGNGFDSTHPEIFLRPQEVVERETALQFLPESAA